MPTLRGLPVIKQLKKRACLIRPLLFAFFIFLPTLSEAQFQNATFWKKRSSYLQYTTAAQSLLAGNCSGITTVKTYNSSGTLTNVASNLTVSLSGPGSVTFYSDSICSTSISQVTISTGTNSASFYFIDTSTSSISLTASATNFREAVQSETIATNPYVWTGGGGNTSWSTAGNWSGGAAPGAGNIALFNSTCLSNCSPSITANISTAGLRMSSGYAGTITQNAGVTITIGTSGWTQVAGTFAGGNAAITLNGNYNLVGGDFTSTSGTMTANKNFLTSGTSTYTHQSGTVTFYIADSSSTITPGTVAYNNVKFQGSNATFSLIGTMTVNGTLTLADAYINGGFINTGTILAYGNVVASSYGYFGTGLVKIAGSTNQTITGVSTAAFPRFEVASTGGTVTYSGTLSFPRNYTFTSGVLDAGTSTTLFNPYEGSYTITPGTVAYNHVKFQGFNTTFSLVGSITVNGTLTLADGYINGGFINTGTILAYGNVVASSYGYFGTGLVKIAGSTDQTITGVSTAAFPKFEVASTGGTVTYSGTLSFRKNYTFTSGVLDAGTSTTLFNPYEGSHTITPGTVAYNHVKFQGFNSTFSLIGTMTVNGTLTLADGYIFGGSINTGTILAYGNVAVSSYGYNGSITIQMTGGTGATLNQSASTALVPLAFSINKTAGTTVTLASAVSLMRSPHSLNVASGSVNMAGYALTIRTSLTLNGNTITKNAGVLTVNSVVAGTGALHGGTVDP